MYSRKTKSEGPKDTEQEQRVSATCIQERPSLRDLRTQSRNKECQPLYSRKTKSEGPKDTEQEQRVSATVFKKDQV